MNAIATNIFENTLHAVGSREEKKGVYSKDNLYVVKFINFGRKILPTYILSAR